MNQPFTPYTDKNISTTVNLWYNVQVKDHSSDNWISIFRLYSENFNPYVYGLQLQSDSENTVISIPQDDLPASGKVDFQVEAIIGTWYPLTNTNFGYFIYETSNWSSTQIIIFSTSPNSTSTPSPTIPEFSSWTIPLLFSIIVVFAGLLISHKRKIKSVKYANIKRRKSVYGLGFNRAQHGPNPVLSLP